MDYKKYKRVFTIVIDSLGAGDAVDAAAFGDSENDMPMLEAAGWGIAMENAEEAVKDKADKVTLSNNEDGIAYAIKKWLLD